MEKNDNNNINLLSILCLIFITLKEAKDEIAEMEGK